MIAGSTTFTLSRLFAPCLAAVIALCMAGCGAPTEIYHCYDWDGRAVDDVFVSCVYSLAGAPTRGVDYRLSDSAGVVLFAPDVYSRSGPPRTLRLIYSTRLHSGGPDARFEEGAGPRPDESVAVTYGTNKIFIKDNSEDPASWYFSLQQLLNFAASVRDRSYAMEGPGIERLEAFLIPYVESERQLFLDKFGNVEVPKSQNIKIGISLAHDIMPDAGEKSSINAVYSEYYNGGAHVKVTFKEIVPSGLWPASQMGGPKRKE